jgi:16S rRNA (guanine527-N7)-methyltransferase
MRDLADAIEQRFGSAARRRLETYQRLLLTWNERLNLTAIVDDAGIWGKHFWDSLLIADAPEWVAARGGRVADVGTGAGFPGVVLAACCPDREYVLCDSLNKRIEFLREVVQALGLDHVQLVHARAEELGRDKAYRGQFHLVLSRAVAKMNVLLELTAPLTQLGGYVCAYKGPGVHDELPDGQRAASRLGLALARLDERELPQDMGRRALVWWKQENPVPNRYPRRPGVPQRQPL